MPWINTCFLHVVPRSGQTIWNDMGFVRLTWWRTFALFLLCYYIYLWHGWERLRCLNYVFTYSLMPHNTIFYFHLPCVHVSNGALCFTWYTDILIIHKGSMAPSVIINPVNVSLCLCTNTCETSHHTVMYHLRNSVFPDGKVYGANMGPIWGRQDPCGPHVGPINFAIWVTVIFVWITFV